MKFWFSSLSGPDDDGWFGTNRERITDTLNEHAAQFHVAGLDGFAIIAVVVDPSIVSWPDSRGFSRGTRTENVSLNIHHDQWRTAAPSERVELVVSVLRRAIQETKPSRLPEAAKAELMEVLNTALPALGRIGSH